MAQVRRLPSPNQPPVFSTELSAVINPVVSVRGLTKTYGKGDTEVRALNTVDLDLARGEFTAIMGASGSGKSTLMHCIAGLDTFNSGTVTVDGKSLSKMSARTLTLWRREHVGFIFQSFNLIPTLTAEENITLPLRLSKQALDKARFNAIVGQLGITDRLGHRPTELSGGQQQKVACARALMGRPAVIFADEPTGNLDTQSTMQVLSFLRQAVEELDQTVLMVTHEPMAAAWAQRVIFLSDGHIVAQLLNPTPSAILEAQRKIVELTAPAVQLDSAAPMVVEKIAPVVASVPVSTADTPAFLQPNTASSPDSPAADEQDASADLAPEKAPADLPLSAPSEAPATSEDTAEADSETPVPFPTQWLPLQSEAPSFPAAEAAAPTAPEALSPAESTAEAGEATEAEIPAEAPEPDTAQAPAALTALPANFPPAPQATAETDTPVTIAEPEPVTDALSTVPSLPGVSSFKESIDTSHLAARREVDAAEELAAQRQAQMQAQTQAILAQQLARQRAAEEAARLEVERQHAARREAERLEAERAEAERLEFQRLEAERLEAERLEAAHLEAERQEAARLEAQLLAEREAARQAAERARLEEIERARLEAEEQARREAEEQARREAARQAAERARLEAAEAERRAAEERAARKAQAEADGQAELEALIAQAERLLAASSEAINSARQDFGRPAAPAAPTHTTKPPAGIFDALTPSESPAPATFPPATPGSQGSAAAAAPAVPPAPAEPSTSAVPSTPPTPAAPETHLPSTPASPATPPTPATPSPAEPPAVTSPTPLVDPLDKIIPPSLRAKLLGEPEPTPQEMLIAQAGALMEQANDASQTLQAQLSELRAPLPDFLRPQPSFPPAPTPLQPAQTPTQPPTQNQPPQTPPTANPQQGR